jgi:hypothetical protein
MRLPAGAANGGGRVSRPHGFSTLRVSSSISRPGRR